MTKRNYYDKKIQKSSNKCKATWDIVKELTNNQHSQPDIQELIIDSKRLKDTSILLTSLNNTQMQSDFNIIFEQLIKLF